LKLCFFWVVLLPLNAVVAGFCVLQLIQQNFILINYFRQASDSICSIQRSIGIETALSWLLNWLFRIICLCRLWSKHNRLRLTAVPLKIIVFIRPNINRWFQIDLKHFSKKDSILILNFTKTFLFLQFFFVIIGNMSWFGRFFHIYWWFYVSEPLHVEQVLLHLFTVGGQTVWS